MRKETLWPESEAGMSAVSGIVGGLSKESLVDVLSHDLRAPVRHLSQLSQLLQELNEQVAALSNQQSKQRLAGVEPQSGASPDNVEADRASATQSQRECLKHIRASAGRCDELLDGLSRLAMVYKSPRAPAKGAARAEHAASALTADRLRAINSERFLALTEQQSQQPVFEQAADASVALRMEPEHWDLLLTELITNSLKFREVDRELKLRCSLHAVAAEVIFEFADNGRGMGPDFIDRCTLLYARESTDVPGIGVGLALVRELVARYHGRIEIQSRRYPIAEAGTVIRLYFPRISEDDLGAE